MKENEAKSHGRSGNRQFFKMLKILQNTVSDYEAVEQYLIELSKKKINGVENKFYILEIALQSFLVIHLEQGKNKVMDGKLERYIDHILIYIFEHSPYTYKTIMEDIMDIYEGINAIAIAKQTQHGEATRNAWQPQAIRVFHRVHEKEKNKIPRVRILHLHELDNVQITLLNIIEKTLCSPSLASGYANTTTTNLLQLLSRSIRVNPQQTVKEKALSCMKQLMIHHAQHENMVNTIIQLLQFKQTVNEWPTCRTETFDSIFADILIQLDHLSDSTRLKLMDTMVSSLDWNLNHSPSKSMQENLLTVLITFYWKHSQDLQIYKAIINHMEKPFLAKYLIPFLKKVFFPYHENQQKRKLNENKESNATKRRKLNNGLSLEELTPDEAEKMVDEEEDEIIKQDQAPQKMIDDEHDVYTLQKMSPTIHSSVKPNFIGFDINHSNYRYFEWLQHKMEETPQTLGCLSVIMSVFSTYPTCAIFDAAFNQYRELLKKENVLLKDKIINIYTLFEHMMMDAYSDICTLVEALFKENCTTIDEPERSKLVACYLSTPTENLAVKLQFLADQSIDVSSQITPHLPMVAQHLSMDDLHVLFIDPLKKELQRLFDNKLQQSLLIPKMQAIKDVSNAVTSESATPIVNFKDWIFLFDLLKITELWNIKVLLLETLLNIIQKAFHVEQMDTLHPYVTKIIHFFNEPIAAHCEDLILRIFTNLLQKHNFLTTYNEYCDETLSHTLQSFADSVKGTSKLKRKIGYVVLQAIGIIAGFEEKLRQQQLILFILNFVDYKEDNFYIWNMIEILASQQRTSSKSLLLSIPEFLSDWIPEQIEQQIRFKKFETVLRMFFNNTNLKRFLQQHLSKILNVFIYKRNAVALKLILTKAGLQNETDIASLRNNNALWENTMNYFIHQNGSVEVNISAFDFIFTHFSNAHTQNDIEKKITNSLVTISTKLALDELHAEELWEQFKVVAKAWTGKKKQLTSSRVNIDKPEAIVINNFYTIIVEIQNYFYHSDSSEKQRQSLVQLNFLISKLGNNLNKYIDQILSVLDTAVDIQPMQSLVVKMYSNMIDKFSICLASHIQRMVVSLYHLVDKYENVIPMINNMLHIASQIDYGTIEKHFPYIGNDNRFHEVLKTIGTYQGLSVMQQLEYIHAHLKREGKNFQRLGLKLLVKVLEQHRYEIHDTILKDNRENAKNPLISSIIESLFNIINGPHINDAETETLMSRALGLIGAVSTSFLCTINVESSVKPFIEDVELITQIIRFVYPQLSNNLLYSAFVIQELLKIGTEAFGSKQNWIKSKLEPHIYQGISEYWTTTYVLKIKENISNTHGITLPIWEENMSCALWSKNLAKFITQNLGREKNVRPNVFGVCQVLMHDESFARHFLCYIVGYSIMYNYQSTGKKIIEEFQHVLKNLEFYMNQHAQLIFSILDTLSHWLLQKENKSRKNLENLRVALDTIPYIDLAHAARVIHADARAYMYYEQHLLETAEQILDQKHVGYSYEVKNDELLELQDIYKHLNEPDEFVGFSSVCPNMNMQNQQLVNEGLGKWQDSLIYYQTSMLHEANEDQNFIRLLECLSKLGQYQQVLVNIHHKLATRYSDEDDLSQFKVLGIQAIWRLGDWKMLPEFLNESPSDFHFDVSLSKSLLAFKNRDSSQLSFHLEMARNVLINQLKSACLESYQTVYPYLIKLHMLNDIESWYQLADDHQDKKKQLAKIMKRAESITEYNIDAREPLLNLRRILLNLVGLEKDVGDCWLEYSLLARKAKYYSTAKVSILEAQRYPQVTNCLLETAKLYWETGDQMPAIHMANNSYMNLDDKTKENDLGAFELRLQAIRWEQEKLLKHEDQLLKELENITNDLEDWEEGYFYYALLLDNVFAMKKKEAEQDLKMIDHSDKNREMKKRKKKAIASYYGAFQKYGEKLLQSYGYCLFFGSNHMFHAIPRMLTLFFKLNMQFYKLKDWDASEYKKNNKRLVAIMTRFIRKVDASKWHTSLSQVLARLNEHDIHVPIVKKIILRVMLRYPRQAIWKIQYVKENEKILSKKGGSNVITDILNMNEIQEHATLFHSMNELFDRLNKCTMVDGNNNAAFMVHQQALCKMSQTQLSEIIVPFRSSLTVNSTKMMSSLEVEEENAFNEPLYIQSIHEKFVKLSSVNAPHKFSFVSNKGKLCSFLLKPGDDIRKDARFMDLCSYFNRLFLSDPYARSRKLNITVFEAIPLGTIKDQNTAGLVEWVDDTTPYRNAVFSQYEALGQYDYESQKVVDRYYKEIKKGLYNISLQNFVKVIKSVKPCFSRWFKLKFPEPAKWFNSRLTFTRSSAVMSILGALVGLGDRHTENILLKENDGKVVHVDFDCMFDKGENFNMGEKVPFRLTSNMAEAMGINQYHGVFHQVCVNTQRIVRENCDGIISFLEAFVQDTVASSNTARTVSNEKLVNEARLHVSRIKDHIKGFVTERIKQRDSKYRTVNAMPLSVEGHVNHLIQEATSYSNLLCMWPFWMPWL